MKHTDFTNILMEHFRNPRFTGELEDATASAKVVNDFCGDVMLLTARIVDGAIDEARFKTYGCTGSIGVSSIFVEKLQGLPIEQAKGLTREQVAEWAGGLEEPKLHCADLVLTTLAELIESFEKGDA